jgi:hypothetical protein
MYNYLQPGRLNFEYLTVLPVLIKVLSIWSQQVIMDFHSTSPNEKATEAGRFELHRTGNAQQFID